MKNKKEEKKETNIAEENVIEEIKVDKKDSIVFNILGIIAIIITIVLVIFVLKNKTEDEIVPLDEKWKLKSDNNSNGMIDIGDEICLSSECFYVISNDGEYLKALAKYNLEIGYNCIYKDSEYTCEKIENETNLQSEKAIGFSSKTYNTDGNYGVIPFSKRIYWKDYDDYDLNDANDLEIDLDVSSNYIGEYLDVYKDKLKYLGQEVNDVTLIERGELINLGCPNIIGSCDTKYNWVYSTSYWTKTSRSKGNVWKIQTSNYFSSNVYNNKEFNGIRPVVVIDLNNFNVEK